MKYLKIFIIGFLVILAIQFGVLVFLENVYFIDNANYSSTKIENSTTKKASNSKLNLEDGSKNVSVSYDGKYIAYLKDNNCYILDFENNDKTEVSANDGMKITYFKWIYDRNRLILAERPINLKSSSNFKFYYYDMDSKSKAELFNEANDKGVGIPISKRSEKIDSIDMSTLTNVIYVKLSDSDNYSRIYSINIMAQKKKISTVTHNIGRIISTKIDNVLLYENLDNGKVYKHGDSQPVEIDGNRNLRLLGVDNNDNVYLALANNDKTQMIYYGNIDDNDWQKVDLKTEVDVDNIYINFKGKIFINDSSNSTINEFSTGKGTSYTGNIIDIYDSGIINEKDNEIYRTVFQ